MTPIHIQGKTILVTGANRGIGRAIVDALLANGAAKVYAAVRNTDSAKPLVAQHGNKIVPIRFDLTDDATIRKAAADAPDTEILIANAGILNKAHAFSDDVFEAFQAEIDANVYALIRIARAFAPVLKSNDGGALVQLNSVVSVKSFPDFATYCASKAAAYSITQALKFQLAEQGTQVFSVHPGPIATDMADSAGLAEIAEPPSLVANAIIAALRSGEFHVWPDTMARQIGAAYDAFAKAIVEQNMSEAPA